MTSADVHPCADVHLTGRAPRVFAAASRWTSATRRLVVSVFCSVRSHLSLRRGESRALVGDDAANSASTARAPRLRHHPRRRRGTGLPKCRARSRDLRQLLYERLARRLASAPVRSRDRGRKPMRAHPDERGRCEISAITKPGTSHPEHPRGLRRSARRRSPREPANTAKFGASVLTTAATAPRPPCGDQRLISSGACERPKPLDELFVRRAEERAT